MERPVRWLDFLPIALFAYGTPLVGHSITGGSCAHAFYLGAALALIQMLHAWYRSSSFDYVALGADLFLIVGALGYAFHASEIISLAFFNQSSMFFWILLVGAIATMVLPGGFIQLSQKNQRTILIGSFGLLIATSVALLISYFLASYTNVRVGMYLILPFVALLALREVLRLYLAKKVS